jgi:HEAT repeat protein
MPERRRASRRVAGILAGAVVVTAIGFLVKFGFFEFTRLGRDGSASGAAKFNQDSPLPVLNEGLRRGDPQALAFVQQRATPEPDAPRLPLSDEQAAAWVDTLSSLRGGFPRLATPGRATAVKVACRILDKFAVEPAPALWIESLKPIHDLLTASLCDAEPLPRYTALVEVSRLWVWIPGRSITPFEELTLGEWKGAIHVPVVRCLAARDPETRVAAVACLGSLPIDSAAVSAVAYVDDPIADVRKQTMSSFSQRNLLLTDDMLLKRLHDDDPGIREMASLILKTRGLSQEQISLGGLIYSPRPDQRVSVIPLLKNRTDLDPVTWLIQLSRDPVEMVRMSSIDALAKRTEPSVQRRLAEMARSDGSPAVRQAASKVVPSADGETTAALPPLPGSSSLNPKAN